MCHNKVLRLLYLSSAISLISSTLSWAYDATDAATDFVSFSVNTTKSVTLDDKSIDEAAFEAMEGALVDKISTKLADLVIKSDLGLTTQFADSSVAAAKQEVLRKEFINNIKNKYLRNTAKYGNSFAGKFAADVIVGLVVNIAADLAKDSFGGAGTLSGEMAAFTVKQARVAWAGQKGPHAAVLESAIVTGEQLFLVVELNNELKDINENNAIGEATNDAQESVSNLRETYKTAPPSEKIRIESKIRSALKAELVYEEGWLSKTKPIPHASAVIDQFVAAMKSADKSKYSTAQAWNTTIKSAHPDQLDGYILRVKEFIENNFYDSARWGGSLEDPVNPAKSQRDLMYASVQIVKDRAKTDTARLRSLIIEARIAGGTKNLSEAKQNLIVTLVKGLDSSLNDYGKQETINRAFVNFNVYAEKQSVEKIDFSTIPESPNSIHTSENQDNTPEEVSNQETAVHEEEQATDTPKAEEKKDPQAIKDAILENHADKEKKKTRKEEILANYNDKKEKQAEQDRIERENEQLRKQREREAIEEQIAKLVAKQDMNNNVVTDAEARIKEEKNQIAVSKYEDLEIVDKSLKSFRSELKKLSLRSDDKASLTKLQRERSTLIEGTKIVRQLQLKRLKVENLTRSQKIKLTLMGSALGYTSAGGKPVWQTVADNIRFTANKIISRVGSIDRTVARLNPLSPAEERKLKLVKQKEVELTNAKIEILNTIKRSEEKIQNYETELAKTRNEMRSNERTLTQLGYDLENYQAPYFTTSPRSDWANYDSPYDAIEVSDLTDEIKAEINPDQSSGPIDSAPVAQPNISTPGVTETGTNAVGSDPGVGGGTAPMGNGQSFTEPGSTEGNSAGEQTGTRPGEGDEEENVTGEGTTEDGDQGADSNSTDGTRTFGRLTTNKQGTGVFNTDSLEPKDENNQIKLSSRIGGGSIKQIETFDASNYFYTKLGKWSAMAGTPSNFSQGGYFATIDGTPTTAIQSLSGSATYSGNIIGEFVKSDGFRDDARGRIELSVNFSNQSVDAQFQLGHNCSTTSGSGPSGCGTVSRVAKITEPINDYLTSKGAGFGNHSDAARTSGESIVGIFGGPNGQEIAGDVFLADNGGYYNGVFQSQRGDIEEKNDKIHWTGSVSGLNQSSSSTHSFTTGGDIDQSPPNIGDTVTLDVTDPTSSTYQIAGTVEGKVEAKNQYLVGGVWSDSLNIKNSGTGQNTTFNRGYFIMGDQTPKSFINQRTGTATYSGEIGADYASPSTGVIYESIEGSINLLADFNSKKVSGNLNMQGPNNFSANTTLDASFYDRGSDHVGYGGNLSGTDSFGGFDGVFYGSKSEETGGSFWYQNNNSGESVTGVYGTGLDSNDDDNFPYLGYIAGKESGKTSLITNNLYTGKPDGGDAPQGERGEARINRNGTNKFYSDGLDSPITVSINESESADGYQYSDWGEWNGTGIIISNLNEPAERGFWVIGHSTPKVDIPTSGSATYNGEVAGIAFNGENIGGSAQLNANFANHNVNGNLNLTRANGSNWVNIQTGDMSYDNIYNNHDFEINFQSANATVTSPNGSVISNAGANIGGMFIGTQAQEIVGKFAVYNIPDSVGGANGVFRAKQ